MTYLSEAARAAECPYFICYVPSRGVWRLWHVEGGDFDEYGDAAECIADYRTLCGAWLAGGGSR